MNNFLTLSYWLNSRPPGLSPWNFRLFAAFVAALAVLAFIFYLLKNKKRSHYSGILEKFNFFFLSNFIIGLLFLFFAFEIIPFLSARILLLIWAVGMILWLIFIARRCLEIPKIKKKKEAEKEFQKYVP